MIDVASEVARTLVPVFSVIGVGWLLSARRIFATEELGRLAITVCSPCFVFSLMSRTEMSTSEGLTLVAGTLCALLMGLALGALTTREDPARRRGAMLCTTFWNSGNLAMSCCGLAYGRAGYEAGAVVFVTVLACQSTLGIWIAKGRGGFGALFRAPLFWGAGLGLLVRGGEVSIPEMVMDPVEMVGGVTIPLMLLTLGGQLKGLRTATWRPSLHIAGLRLTAGVVTMTLFVWVVSVHGVARDVLLVNAIMPGAVMNVVLAQRYSAAPERVASVTVVGTVVSAALLPLVLGWLHSNPS